VGVNMCVCVSHRDGGFVSRERDTRREGEEGKERQRRKSERGAARPVREAGGGSAGGTRGGLRAFIWWSWGRRRREHVVWRSGVSLGQDFAFGPVQQPHQKPEYGHSFTCEGRKGRSKRQREMGSKVGLIARQGGRACLERGACGGV
jgi:hypothetical protein